MFRKIVSQEETRDLVATLSKLKREAEKVGIVVNINIANVSQLKWDELPEIDGVGWWKTIYKRVPIKISAYRKSEVFRYHINDVEGETHTFFRDAEIRAMAEVDNIVQFWEHPKGGQHGPR